MGAAKRSVFRFLTKLNFFDLPGLVSEEEQCNFFIPDSHFLVPDVWAKVPKYFQAPSQNQNLFAGPASNSPFV